MLLSAWNVRRGTSVMLRLLVAATFVLAATVAGASPANAGADDERLLRLSPHKITLTLGEISTHTITVTNISRGTVQIVGGEVFGYNIDPYDPNGEASQGCAAKVLSPRDTCSIALTFRPSIGSPASGTYCMTGVTQTSTPVADRECGSIRGKAH